MTIRDPKAPPLAGGAPATGLRIDVTDLVRRRKRIVRGATAAKVLTLLTGVMLVLSLGNGLLFLVLPFVGRVGWRTADRLRFGDARVAVGLLVLVGIDLAMVLIGVPLAAAGRLGIGEGALGFHEGFGGRAVEFITQPETAVWLIPYAVWRWWSHPRVRARLRLRTVRLVALCLGSFAVVIIAGRLVSVLDQMGVPDSAFGVLAFQVPLIAVLAIGVASVLGDRRRRTQAAMDPLVPPPWETTSGVRQRRLFTGKRPVRVSLFLLLTALMVAGGLLAIPGSSHEPQTQEEAVVAAVLRLLSVICPSLAVVFYTRARRHATLGALDVRTRDGRSPVLYLRSFGDDRLRLRARRSPRRPWFSNLWSRRRERFEEVLVWQLWRHGPVIAVGRPGEPSAPLGSAREYLPDETWRQQVEERMRSSRLVVVVLGRTEGVEWEMRRAADLRLSTRTLVVVPPVEGADLEERLTVLTRIAPQVGWPSPDAGLFDGALVAVLRPDSGWLVYGGQDRDEWHYEIALEAAARAVLGGGCTP